MRHSLAHPPDCGMEQRLAFRRLISTKHKANATSSAVDDLRARLTALGFTQVDHDPLTLRPSQPFAGTKHHPLLGSGTVTIAWRTDDNCLLVEADLLSWRRMARQMVAFPLILGLILFATFRLSAEQVDVVDFVVIFSMMSVCGGLAALVVRGHVLKALNALCDGVAQQ